MSYNGKYSLKRYLIKEQAASRAGGAEFELAVANGLVEAYGKDKCFAVTAGHGRPDPDVQLYDAKTKALLGQVECKGYPDLTISLELNTATHSTLAGLLGYQGGLRGAATQAGVKDPHGAIDKLQKHIDKSTKRMAPLIAMPITKGPKDTVYILGATGGPNAKLGDYSRIYRKSYRDQVLGSSRKPGWIAGSFAKGSVGANAQPGKNIKKEVIADTVSQSPPDDYFATGTPGAIRMAYVVSDTLGLKVPQFDGTVKKFDGTGGQNSTTAREGIYFYAVPQGTPANFSGNMTPSILADGSDVTETVIDPATGVESEVTTQLPKLGKQHLLPPAALANCKAGMVYRRS